MSSQAYANYAIGRVQRRPVPLAFSIFAVALLLSHVLLAVIVRDSPGAAGLHAALVAAVSLWVAINGRAVATACCAAYVVGAEVLWRMSKAPIFYESGKYLVALIFLIALVRMGRRVAWRSAPLIYFLVLLPSALLVFGDQDLSLREAMMRLSFNLSGPLCLATAVWFFSQQRLNSKDLLRISVWLMAPVLSIAVLTIISTRAATDLRFTDESNFATSGGFGPNQVSAVLGLGALIGVLAVLNREARGPLRVMFAALVLLLATQSAMTFSRGGLYGAAIALTIGAPFLLSERRVRRILVALAAFLAIAAAAVVMPRLNEFTHGKLQDRFRDTEPSHRVELALEDLKIWRANPLVGVGPGMVKDYRSDVPASGHTEYTRLLAEHGSYGLIALLLLVVMASQAVMNSADRVSRGYRIVFISWALLSMLHAAMRIAAFGFVFGMAYAALQLANQHVRATGFEAGRSYPQN